MSISAKDRDRLIKLLGMMGSSHAAEAESARQKILELLKRWGLTWNDLTAALSENNANEAAQEQPADDNAAAQDDDTAEDFQLNPLDVIFDSIQERVDLSADQAIAVTLWIAHCFVFERFPHSPRLFVTAPLQGCGKSTLMAVIETLVPNPARIDGATDAVLFRILDHRSSLLLDEVDNADLAHRPVARQILNTGHARNAGAVARVIKGEVRQFSVFAPLAIAAIKRIHSPLMDRSLVIKMARTRRKLLDVHCDDSALAAIHDYTFRYFRFYAESLNLDPQMPQEFQNRFRDNWRALLSVADLVGGDWPAFSRQAALSFSQNHAEEDLEILCIQHCLQAFRAHGVDRLATVDLLADLHAIDSPWGQWTGVAGDKRSICCN